MKSALLLIVTLLFAPLSHAADEARISELLRVTEMEKMYSGLMSRTEGQFAQMKRQILADPSLSPKQREVAEHTLETYLDKTLVEFSWQKMKPFMVSLYSDIYSDQEIDDMIAFYKTPTGQAVIAKTPVVFEKSMQHFQGRMNAILGDLQQTLREELAKAGPAKTSPSKSPAKKQ
jgi:hypothetical protein